MNIAGKDMIHQIQTYVHQGALKEAYKFALEHDCIEEEYQQQITCFRYLLGCINGETGQNNQFSFTSTPNIQPQGFESIKHQMDIKCQGKMFEHLRQLCKEY
ncbi:hypothetical protein [Candidatus Xianfuyuplasma coldseepsis]|uniref:Uncharacterized protein n=1 Tax=Candidatus Xianfuyuplasma coldseepsis TaxID=2782163 RepID=A0A7L7KTL3_9MOLU|nr:hypothetical protein [Xianfuyuplasma coldseepsis]QMS85314.1 hypothetical protein G4Z02_05960 [Xianfuyuplasma coldseepsis]